MERETTTGETLKSMTLPDDEERIFRVALEICEELGGFSEETTLVKGRSGAAPRTHPSSWWRPPAGWAARRRLC